jgi:hypothetical protein
MIRRATTSLTLALYGVIALAGQGLHAWVHEDCDHHGGPAAAVCGVSGGLQFDGDAKPQAAVSGQADDDCQHDPDHCAICQHQALGQFFVATPPVQAALDVCELLSPLAPEAVVCPVLFSVAQPRAPPV